MLRALIVGLGSIGKRHLRNLRAVEPAAEITVLRHHDPGGKVTEPPPDADRIVYSVEDAIRTRPQIAIIANPASLHIDIAMQLARAGASLLVEKPISNRVEGVPELILTCADRGLALMVGYNLRFQPALQALKECADAGTIGRVLALLGEVGQYLPDWRPGQAYTEGVSAQAKLGGGVVLELSHELDYARWLMGEVVEVTAQTRRLSGLKLDVEDSADILLTFASGASGSIHLDMLQRDAIRRCRLIGTDGTLAWDGLTNEVNMYSASHNTWQRIFAQRDADRNDMFVSELKAFLRCVANRSAPPITGEDGLRVLDVALAVHRSSQLHRTVSVVPRMDQLPPKALTPEA